MVLCRQQHDNGFTNHRVQVEPYDHNGQLGWLCSTSKPEPQTFLADIPALEYHLKMVRCSANSYLAAAANAAIDKISNR